MNSPHKPELGGLPDGVGGHSAHDQLLLSQLQQQLAAAQAQHHLSAPRALAGLPLSQGLGLGDGGGGGPQHPYSAALSHFGSGAAAAVAAAAAPPHAASTVSTSDLLRHIQATQASPPQLTADAAGLGAWQPSHQTIQDLMSSLPPTQHPFLSDLGGHAAPTTAPTPVSMANLHAAAAAYAAGGGGMPQQSMLRTGREHASLQHVASQSATPDSTAHLNGLGGGATAPGPSRSPSAHTPVLPPPHSGGGRAPLDPSHFLQAHTDLPQNGPAGGSLYPSPAAPLPPVDARPPLAPDAPAGAGGGPLVLAAKVLTESDIKQSRAILPRIAVESNLPFLLGFRTFGLIMPDAAGTQWEFTVKSWANGRADRAQTERKKDRRVYVVEQMARYLAAHQLAVGDIIGIVAVNGQLEMHNRTQELRAWIERPTYGPSDVAVNPTTVPAKCVPLEDISPDDTTHRQCRRSAVCNKPDGHPGFCVGTQHGPKPRTSGTRNAKLKLHCWPPPRDLLEPALPEQDGRAPPLADLPLDQMPATGVLLSFRIMAQDAGADAITLPPDTILKVPASVSRQRGLRLAVEDAAGGEHSLYAVALEARHPAEGGGGGGLLDAGPLPPQWMLGGLEHIVKAAGACQDDEVGIERQAGKLVFFRIPAHQLAPPQAQWAAPVRPANATADTLLCQRSQGCLKAVHHSGACSDHKGYKRKDRGSPPPGHTAQKRRTEGKRKPKAQRPPDHSTEGQAWAGAKLDALVPAQPPADMPWPDNANAMGMFVPPAPGANAQQEEDLAADVLVALSGGHKSTAAAGGMPQEKGAEFAMVAAGGGGGVAGGTLNAHAVGLSPHAGPPPDGLKSTLEEQISAMRDDHGPEQSGDGDGEEDSTYLELLMQNAMSNLRRDSHEPQGGASAHAHHPHAQLHKPPNM